MTTSIERSGLIIVNQVRSSNRRNQQDLHGWILPHHKRWEKYHKGDSGASAFSFAMKVFWGRLEVLMLR
jgi:hypothetical protein